jgi:tripartite-type tricarboxylate transporter receptor subunit TctC
VKTFAWLAAAIAAFSVAQVATAQPYPSKPIRMVVPFPPGGGADTLARPLGERMRQRLGQPVILENRSGAGSNIGTAEVARAKPDGYTLLINTDGIAIYPHLYSKLTYDVFKDLTPVTFVANSPLLLGAHPALPAGNVKELVALAKKEAGKLNFANPGLGTPHHLAFELFARTAGISVGQASYRGGGPALTDVLGGHVQLGMFTYGAVQSHVHSGTLKPIAVMTERRSEVAPNLPTVSESLAGVHVNLRFVIMAPAGTPKDIVGRLQTTISDIVKEPEFRNLLRQQGYEAVISTPEETTAMMRSEYDRWGPILKTANIKLD